MKPTFLRRQGGFLIMGEDTRICGCNRAHYIRRTLISSCARLQQSGVSYQPDEVRRVYRKFKQVYREFQMTSPLQECFLHLR
jgi:hypothetical protein